jgi:branched-chain amino acid transport system substrate-binding protein
MTANYSSNLDTDINQAFVASYEERTGVKPGDTAALTYDAINLIATAIQASGQYDPESIRDSLYELEPYEGVSGQIDYIENGDPQRSAVILKFQDGLVIFYRLITP